MKATGFAEQFSQSIPVSAAPAVGRCKAPSVLRARRAEAESLEARRLLTISVSGPVSGVLTVTGDNSASLGDSISVYEVLNTPTIKHIYVRDNNAGTDYGPYSQSALTRIDVVCRAGPDYVDVEIDNDHTIGELGVDVNVRLFGDAGSDTLYAGDQNDTLEGGTGVDYLYGRDGTDTIRGDGASTTTFGNTNGTGNEDYLDGGDKNDSLYGQDSRDSLYGGAGDDLMYGDYVTAGSGNIYEADDYLYGDLGDDNMSGDTGSVSFGYGSGDDEIDGGDGADTIRGEALNSSAYGSDTITGGAGSDTVRGGYGFDVFHMWDNGTADVIYYGWETSFGYDTVNSDFDSVDSVLYGN